MLIPRTPAEYSNNCATTYNTEESIIPSGGINNAITVIVIDAMRDKGASIRLSIVLHF